MRSFCFIPGAIAMLMVLLASPARTQAVLGFGDDATTVPAGTIRLGFLNGWTRFDQRFTAPDGGHIDANSRVRRTPVFLEMGVMRGLALGVMVPSVGTSVVATYFPALASPGHADSVRFSGQSAIGDVESWAKFTWLGASSEQERTQPQGIHLRSAVVALARLGTGSPPHASRQLTLGTDDGQTDIEIESQWDVIIGPRFWVSAVGRYVHQLPVTRVTRIAPRDDPFTPPVLVNTRIEPGDYYEIEATPRLSLGNHFLVGAQYNHRRDNASTFRQSGEPSTPGAPDDPSVLDVASSSSTRLGFGVVYSSVASYVAGRTRRPFEVSLQYFTLDRWSDGVPPAMLAGGDRSTVEVGLRYYVALWRP